MLIFSTKIHVSSRFAVTPCVISTIAKLRYRFWKEPNRTTHISAVAKWEIWFRENQIMFFFLVLQSVPMTAFSPLSVIMTDQRALLSDSLACFVCCKAILTEQEAKYQMKKKNVTSHVQIARRVGLKGAIHTQGYIPEKKLSDVLVRIPLRPKPTRGLGFTVPTWLHGFSNRIFIWGFPPTSKTEHSFITFSSHVSSSFMSYSDIDTYGEFLVSLPERYHNNWYNLHAFHFFSP